MFMFMWYIFHPILSECVKVRKEEKPHKVSFTALEWHEQESLVPLCDHRQQQQQQQQDWTLFIKGQ